MWRGKERGRPDKGCLEETVDGGVNWAMYYEWKGRGRGEKEERWLGLAEAGMEG